MAQQTKKTVMRAGAFDDRFAVAQQVAAGLLYGEVSVNPPSMATNTESQTSVALPAGTAKAGALVFVQPPTDGSLEAGLVPLGARISADDTLQIKLRNVTGATIDGAAKTWTYFVISIPQLVIQE